MHYVVRYKLALDAQPTLNLLDRSELRVLAVVAFLLGSLLVISSMYALGVTGTYLGDYSGILMEEKVEGFPFNVTDNPMYYGSTLSFFGTALWLADLPLLAFVYRQSCGRLIEQPESGINRRLDSR